MSERATRPLNQGAVKAADDELYAKHADDPRPNALFDAAGHRKPLDANDPDQADLRSEWMASYKAHGGQTEPSNAGHAPSDQGVASCDQRAEVNPLIRGIPVALDESDDALGDWETEELAADDAEDDGKQA